MSFQYIHTSAKRGLEPGKSGFCCVARDRDLPPDLISELESQSRYTTDSHGSSPLILRHRFTQIRSGSYHILSRIHEAGTDYSKRNNHIAHHIAFREDETPALPNPAAILLNWRGWRDIWDEPPRTLEAFEAFDLQDIESFWAVQSQATPFPQVVHEGKASSFVFNISIQQERQLIEHLRRAINDLPASQRWTHTFTSCLLPTDQPQDYDWSGILTHLSLPYEVDFTPRPLETKPIPTPPQKPSEPPPKIKIPKDKPEPQPATPPPPSRPKQPIRVEIPEDYDRRKSRRRVKRPIGQREFSRLINVLIVAAALTCFTLFYFFLRTREASPISNPSLLQDDPGVPSLEERTDAWQAFVYAGFPRSDLAAIRPVAEFLDATGEDTPLQTLEFLETLANSPQELDEPYLLVPSLLIQRTSNAAFRLPLSPIGYPIVKRLALLPAFLQDPLAQLSLATPAVSLGPAAGLTNADYSPEALARSLATFRLRADSDFQSIPLATREAIESYDQQRQAVLDNHQYAPILSIHKPFALPVHIPYLAFDEQGLLESGSPMSLAQYLRELFLNAVEQSDDLALQSTLFQTYLNRIATDSSDSALETASLIDGAISSLELSERPRNDYWRRIQDQWRQAFMRKDLMEQTILGYTLDALQTTKLQLADTRSQFSQAELALKRSATQRDALIEDIIQASREAARPKEWIVIPAQSSKVPPSEP